MPQYSPFHNFLFLNFKQATPVLGPKMQKLSPILFFHLFPVIYTPRLRL